MAVYVAIILRKVGCAVIIITKIYSFMKNLIQAALFLAATPTLAFATLTDPYGTSKSLPDGYLGDCPASNFEFLVGKKASLLGWLSNDTNWVRFILPGKAYTMEYVPDRLNVHIDPEGKVERVSCG